MFSGLVNERELVPEKFHPYARVAILKLADCLSMPFGHDNTPIEYARWCAILVDYLENGIFPSNVYQEYCTAAEHTETIRASAF